MTDARKTGPFGEGGEAQPITVDLTRIDIRRGTLYLPRRFYGALPEGELQAKDAAAGKTMTVTFEPPRQLEGLGPFYEEHDLRPNDAVSLSMADGLQLTPVRRERRQAAASTPAEPRETQVPDRQASPQYDGKVNEGKGVWQDVLHDPTPRPHPGGFSKPEAAPRPAAPPVPRADEPALEEPPFDAGSGEARHVAPRDLSRLGLGREKTPRAERPDSAGAEPTIERRPERSDLERLRPEFLVQQHERLRKERQQTGRAGQFGSEVRAEEPAEGHLVREKAAPEGRSSRAEAKPLAPAGGDTQQGLFQSTAGAAKQTKQQPKPAAEHEEREPVMVGAGGEGAAVGQIDRYLQDPRTPAIVRAEAVAEALKLPVETAKKGLAEAARASEGSITAIRPDVYLVKRSR